LQCVRSLLRAVCIPCFQSLILAYRESQTSCQSVVQLSIEMLIQFGAHKEELQLILLTPQHAGAIAAAELRVQEKMKDNYPEGELVLKRQMLAPRAA